MQRDAFFSPCRRYRYALWRIWNERDPYALFIGLNPSTADEQIDDPTIRRCMGFAKNWGNGGLCMVNLFAYCATSPIDLLQAEDPVGPDNDEWMNKLAACAGVVIAAWGNHGTYLHRANQVLERYPGIKCLKINRTGEPAHPLYLPGSLRPLALHNR